MGYILTIWFECSTWYSGQKTHVFIQIIKKSARFSSTRSTNKKKLFNYCYYQHTVNWIWAFLLQKAHHVRVVYSQWRKNYERICHERKYYERIRQERKYHERNCHERNYYERFRHERNYYERFRHERNCHERKNYGKPNIHNNNYYYYIIILLHYLLPGIFTGAFEVTEFYRAISKAVGWSCDCLERHHVTDCL